MISVQARGGRNPIPRPAPSKGHLQRSVSGLHRREACAALPAHGGVFWLLAVDRPEPIPHRRQAPAKAGSHQEKTRTHSTLNMSPTSPSPRWALRHNKALRACRRHAP